jgi:Mg2+-importing ATPase
VITFARALDTAGPDSDRPLLPGLICNEATVTAGNPVGGNALDQALWSAPGAAPGEPEATTAGAWQRLGVLPPFDHERQLASVLVKDPGGHPS